MLKIPFGRLSEPQRLSCLNWAGEFPYMPSVQFRIGYEDNGIHLEYTVDEQSVRALQDVPGGFVYKDSCVEFFFRPSADDPHYYNFEWNAIGTMYLAWRTGRQDPLNAPEEVLGLVKAKSSLGRKPFAEKPAEGPWTLKLFIPVEAFWKGGLPLKDGKPSLHGLQARANFFKCGDGLKVPHFVTWAPISTPKPDYHRPEFFDVVEFE